MLYARVGTAHGIQMMYDYINCSVHLRGCQSVRRFADKWVTLRVKIMLDCIHGEDSAQKEIFLHCA